DLMGANAGCSDGAALIAARAAVTHRVGRATSDSTERTTAHQESVGREHGLREAKNMGELRLRGKTWWIRYYRNGRRHEESARTEKKTEAEWLLKLREGAIARGEPITAAMARVTVDQALTRVEEDYGLKGQRSLADTRRRIKKHLLPFFAGRR